MLDLAFSRVPNQSLTIGKSNIRGCGPVSLIICNDLHLNASLVIF